MNPATVRVKICGLTSIHDAVGAAQAGADAIGLNFVAGPRKIGAPLAGQILEALPDTVETWALLDLGDGQVPGQVQPLVSAGRFHRVQIYGRVTGHTLDVLSDLGLSTVVVRHLADPTSVDETRDWLDRLRPAQPDLILLDAAAKNQLGGTGKTLNWQMLADGRAAGHLTGWPAIVLAGGLTPENVANAVNIVRPAWVDVAGGVEDRPGNKNPEKVRDFVQRVKSIGQ